MNLWIELGVVLLALLNLVLLGSSRVKACIRLVAWQGILLGAMPALLQAENLSLRLLGQAAAGIVLKGIVFPRLLVRAVRATDAQREASPPVGYTPSVLLGVALLAAAHAVAARLPVAGPPGAGRVAVLALMTLMVGLFLIVGRRLAVNQVLGYLVMENGIYAMGMTLAEQEPLLVEIGILLDVFMAVFVMGLTLYQISRTFDHIDTERLNVLKD